MFKDLGNAHSLPHPPLDSQTTALALCASTALLPNLYWRNPRASYLVQTQIMAGEEEEEEEERWRARLGEELRFL